MRISLFLRIVEGVKNHDPYFQNTNDCTRYTKFLGTSKVYGSNANASVRYNSRHR
ncbi:hypothetical protein LINPERPRIM_LOCUS37420 [Linum perenne]